MPTIDAPMLLNMTFHGFLLFVVMLQYRRLNVLERALAECLQSAGKVKDTTLDSLQKP
jgi:hypothetical protein